MLYVCQCDKFFFCVYNPLSDIQFVGIVVEHCLPAFQQYMYMYIIQ